jgi:purine-nucleoside phosphorylase
MQFYSRPEFEAAAEYVKVHTRHQPRVGIVLGSGLGDLADSVQDADIIPYNRIPHWPLSTVLGHVGQMHIGWLEGTIVLVMRGRAHAYEGYPLSQVTLPVRVMQLLDMEIVILTNAAGGLDTSFAAGDIMLITDHLNLIGVGGNNPLRGPNDESLGVRFPDMSRVYDRELRELALEVARDTDIPLQQGVYAGLPGPSFETPAEIRFLRTIGAQAVGMSTVPEAIVARHGGIRVLGFSGIANIAIDDPDSETETTHDEVLDAGKTIVPRLTAILTGILQRLTDES